MNIMADTGRRRNRVGPIAHPAIRCPAGKLRTGRRPFDCATQWTPPQGNLCHRRWPEIDSGEGDRSWIPTTVLIPGWKKTVLLFPCFPRILSGGRHYGSRFGETPAKGPLGKNNSAIPPWWPVVRRCPVPWHNCHLPPTGPPPPLLGWAPWIHHHPVLASPEASVWRPVRCVGPV